MESKQEVTKCVSLQKTSEKAIAIAIHCKDCCYILVPCEPGTYTDGDVCSPCPEGQYQDEYDQTECKPCVDGKLSSTARTTCAGKILT